MKLRKTLYVATLAVLSTACSLPVGSDQPFATYDFGPALAAVPAPGTLVSGRPALIVADVVAPSWLEGNYMFYRMAFTDMQQPRAYAQSRWIMSPPQLVTQRAKLRLSRIANVLSAVDVVQGTMLRLEMLEFSQVFDSPESSRGTMSMRASLIADGKLVAQRTFESSVIAGSANALGGVRALTNATDRMLDELAGWLEVHLHQRPKVANDSSERK